METTAEGGLARSLPMGWVALGSSVAAVLAIGAAAGWWPSQVGAAGAAWLLFGGLGLPVVARWSPAEPSLLKLLLFASLLSPVLALVTWLGLAEFAGPEGALIGTWCLALVLQPLLVGRRAASSPLGRWAGLAVLFAVLLAGVVAVVTLRGSAPRVSYHGLLHAAIAEAVGRGAPPENPFLAGADLSYYWAYHALASLVSRALAVAPTIAFAWINVWAAFVSALALYFAAAVVWRDGRADLVSAALGLLGLNALGGWLWLRAGAPLGAPSEAMEVLAQLRLAVPEGGDPRLAVGFSKLGNVSSHPVAMAYVCGALAAAAHALRRGRRPWPGLCALCLGAAFALNPILGGVAFAALAAAAFLLVEKPRVGRRLLLCLLVGMAPGAALVLLASGASERPLLAFGEADTTGLDPVLGVLFAPARLGEAVRVVGPLLLAALPTLIGPAGAPDRAGRRTVCAALWLLALLPLALYPFVRLPLDNQYKLVRLAAVPLGLLAGGGLVRAWCAGGVWRLGSVAVGAPLLCGVVASNVLGIATYLSLARSDLAVAEGGGVLRAAPAAAAPEARDLARAWVRLRDEVAPARPDLALVVDPASPVAAVASPGAFNLQGHEAPALTGLAVWVDRESYLVRHDPLWRPRLAVALTLFAPGATPAARAAALVAIEAVGRPVGVVLTAPGRAAAPGLEAVLVDAGYEVLVREGSVTIRARPTPLGPPSDP